VLERVLKASNGLVHGSDKAGPGLEEKGHRGRVVFDEAVQQVADAAPGIAQGHPA